MRPCVFIQTNPKQIVGARVAEHAMRRNSAHPDAFDVRVMNTTDHPFLAAREGQTYLRDGVSRIWLNDDLQSFTPLRFMPPELMGYRGRALVIDPDIFAVGDVHELLTRDMQGAAILCRGRSGTKGRIDNCMATSVMLLDCEKLADWHCATQFSAMFAGELDYADWICLKRSQDRGRVGPLENEWNDFDRLTSRTKMLHTTRRRTQPWKTGLPVDWRPAERFRLFPPIGWLMRARRHLFGEYGLLGRYKPHPDQNQERLFFGLLKECLDAGTVTEAMLREEMARNHVRHDALEVVRATRPLAPPPALPLPLPA